VSAPEGNSPASPSAAAAGASPPRAATVSTQELSPEQQSHFHEDGLVRAMTPVTEQAIRRSVELNPKILAEALFPIMAPAIRRSIASALEGMMRALNAAVENSLSPQSVRWRVEAWRTGRSFAEVVVVRTLVFRVEQVFLIEKDGGTLLQHVAIDPKLAENSELVSAMLTAIQDFVRDSFRTPQGESIGSVTIGDLTLWIESGPQAVVAAVIRGAPPHDLRDVLHDTLVAIHQQHLKPLTSFSGDAEIFAPARELLEGCLRQQRLPDAAGPAEKGKRRVTPATVVLALAIAGLVAWTVLSWREMRRWEALQAHVRSQPGVVLLSAERKGDRYHLEGLFDPLADDPLAGAQRFGIPPEKIRARWTPYQSLEPRIVTRRAREEAARLREKIESAVIAAPGGLLTAFAQGELARVAAAITALDELGPRADRTWMVEIVADEAATNAAVSFLQWAGVPAGLISRGGSGEGSAPSAAGEVRFRVLPAGRE
jgi:hypothetical protein